jgi:hypothetical protein
MRFLPGRETLGSRVPGILRAPVPHFGGLKIGIVPYLAIFGSRVSGFFEGLIDILAAGKCDSFLVIRPSAQGYMDSEEPLFVILAAWKSNSSRVVRPTAKGYLATAERMFGIMVAWKCDSCQFLRPPAKGYLATRNRFGIFGDLKM